MQAYLFDPSLVSLCELALPSSVFLLSWPVSSVHATIVQCRIIGTEPIDFNEPLTRTVDCPTVYNPDPGEAMGALLIVHYTSRDLQNWTFAEVARSSPVAYDSDVFRIGDGRWILFSTMQDRPKSGGPALPRQSRDLFNWTDCEDQSLQINVRLL